MTEPRVSEERVNLIADCPLPQTPSLARDLALDLRDARAQVERLRGALEPFSAHYARVKFWNTDKEAAEEQHETGSRRGRGH